MISRRSFIVAGAGALVAPFADAAPTAAAPRSAPATGTGPAWSSEFAGAQLAIGASLDLRAFVTGANRAALTFALNPGSVPIAGILTLTSTGLLTRIGHGAIAGVLIDVDDGT